MKKAVGHLHSFLLEPEAFLFGPSRRIGVSKSPVLRLFELCAAFFLLYYSATAAEELNPEICRTSISTEEEFDILASKVPAPEGFGSEEVEQIGAILLREESSRPFAEPVFLRITLHGEVLGHRATFYCSRAFFGLERREYYGFFIARKPSGKRYLLHTGGGAFQVDPAAIRRVIVNCWRRLQDRFHIGVLYFMPTCVVEREAFREGGSIPLDTGGPLSTFEVYSTGEAFGYLRYIPDVSWNEVRTSGSLTRTDICLLETIPVDFDIPVAGVITASRQGILSHVNILALREGIPNLYVDGAPELLADLIDKPVHLTVTPDGWQIEETSDASVIAWLLSRRPLPLDVSEPDDAFRDLPSLDEISGCFPIDRCGGKAAYMARFLPGIPVEARVKGFVVPFSYFSEFLHQNFFGDLTFAEVIQLTFRNPQFRADSLYRRRALRQIRDMIRYRSRVSRGLIENIARRAEEVFGSLQVKLRFRSSSNAEDSIFFPGAGLYDSTSGCPADSMDHDGSSGPSRCDPSEPEERTLGRALRKVWASLYNQRAVEERLWYGIPEESVRMGILVTEAFEDEKANGVAFTRDPVDPTKDWFLVTAQFGEISVVRPPSGVTPEVSVITKDEDDSWVATRILPSSIAQTPRQRVLSEEQLLELAPVLESLASRWSPPTGIPASLTCLDVEFKITSRGALVIKQVRPYLLPGASVFRDAPLLRASFGAAAFLVLPVGVKNVFQKQQRSFVVELEGDGTQIPCYKGQSTTAWIRRIRSIRGYGEPTGPAVATTTVGLTRWNEGDLDLAVHLSQSFTLGHGKVVLSSDFDTSVSRKGPPLSGRKLTLQLSQIQVSSSLANWKAKAYPEHLAMFPLRRLVVKLEGGGWLTVYERVISSQPREGIGVRAEITLGGETEIVEDPLRITVASGVYPQRRVYLISPRADGEAILLEFLFGRSDPLCHILKGDGSVLKTLSVESWAERLVQTVNAVAFLRGDVNADGILSMADPLRLLKVLFSTEEAFFACPDAADLNDDGRITVSDAVLLLHLLFEPPGEPRACSFDETEDDLGQCAYGPWLCRESRKSFRQGKVSE